MPKGRFDTKFKKGLNIKFLDRRDIKECLEIKNYIIILHNIFFKRSKHI